MNKTILIIVGIVVVVAVGWFVYSMISPSSNTHMTEDKMMKDESMMEGDSMMEKDEDAMMDEGSYGTVIAGTSSPFVEFNKDGYEKALSDGKIVFLDFYANWCPICRVEAPIIDSGFNGFTTEDIVGFRVNFNDSDTDSDEKKLAEEFNIPYQHTKVLLVDGKEVARSQEQWNASDFSEFFGKVVN